MLSLAPRGGLIARAWRLQIIVLLALAAFVVAAVAISWARGADRWHEAGELADVTVFKPLYNEELELYIARSPEGDLLALSGRGPLRNEKIEFCISSKMFEGEFSFFDRYGTHYGGASPRGMTRFPVRVEDGVVYVQPQRPIEGPDRGEVAPLEPEGRLCLRRLALRFTDG